jgi:hypothetical protein
MNVLELARESGLAVLLDGRIGCQEYTSVSGSMDALLRFAAVVRMASLRERKRCRRHASFGRLGRHEPRLSIELRLHEEILLTDKRKRRTVTYFRTPPAAE